MANKANSRRSTSSVVRARTAKKFKRNNSIRHVAVKRSEWMDLDLSSFKVVLSSALQKHSTCRDGRQSDEPCTGSNAKSSSATRRVSWEGDDNESSNKEIESYTEVLVQTLVNRKGMPRTSDQDSPCVSSPHEHDVVLGRGTGMKNHLGNLSYRVFCWNAREAYLLAPRDDKSSVVASVIQNVLNRNPPGRFLEIDEEKSSFGFVEAPMDRVRAKIGSALRERKWSAPLEILERLELVPKKETASEAIESTPTSVVVAAQAATTTNDDIVMTTPTATPLSIVVAPPTSNNMDLETPKENVAQPKTTIPPVQREKVAKVPKPTPLASAAIGIALTEPIIGPSTRIAVYWPMDQTYYPATVVERMQNCVSLLYDDNESEWIDLTKHTFRVLHADEQKLPSPASSSSSTTPLSSNVLVRAG